MNRICVYCGSSPGKHPAYREAAVLLAQALAQRGIGLVYGGGSVGIMGSIADAMGDAGAEVIGVIPRALDEKEVSHAGLSELVLVDSMHERKALMAELSDGFVALPGGLGTIEELFEVLTWTQLGFHQKPCGLLNVQGYFDQLVAFLDHAVEQAFVKPVHRNMLLLEEQPGPLLQRMATFLPPADEKWIGRKGEL